MVNGRPLNDEDCVVIYAALKVQALDYYAKGVASHDDVQRDHSFCQANYYESLAKDFEKEAIIAVHD